MTPQRRKRLLSLALILVIVGATLLVVFGVPFSPAKKATSRPPSFVYTLGNATGNNTGNSTTNQTKLINDQIALLWNQLYSSNGLWPRMLQMETTLYYVGIAIAAAFVLNLVGMALQVRYLKGQLKVLREERIGPEDPNLYAVLEPIIADVIGEELGDAIDKRAKADVMRRIRQRAAERRTREPGVAGRLQED